MSNRDDSSPPGGDGGAAGQRRFILVKPKGTPHTGLDVKPGGAERSSTPPRRSHPGADLTPRQVTPVAPPAWLREQEQLAEKAAQVLAAHVRSALARTGTTPPPLPELWLPLEHPLEDALVVAPPPRRSGDPALVIKYVYLVSIVAGVVFLISSRTLGLVWLSVVPGLVGMFWLLRSWQFIEPGQRSTDDGTAITPRQAAVRMVVPIYNLYWIFVATAGLCQAINRQLPNHAWNRAPARAAMLLSVAFALTWWILPLSPALPLGFAFMVVCDRAKQHLLEPASGGVLT
jgi:hypothetical protein